MGHTAREDDALVDMGLALAQVHCAAQDTIPVLVTTRLGDSVRLIGL